MKYKQIKNEVYKLIDQRKSRNLYNRIFNTAILILIVLNVLAIMLETFSSLQSHCQKYFYCFEVLSVVIFTLEYLLRLWVADLKYPELGPVKGRLRYAVSFMALIDLMAILPFYLPMIITLDLRFLRILRLTRMFRIFKITRYSSSLKMMGNVLSMRKEELLISVFVTFLLLVFASTLMFQIEHDAQPDVFVNILNSFWWAVATFTTVGYGDIYPKTGLGRMLSGIIAILGIGLVALPTAIISSGFMEQLSKKGKEPVEDNHHTEKKYCPYCGKKLD